MGKKQRRSKAFHLIERDDEHDDPSGKFKQKFFVEVQEFERMEIFHQ